MSPTNSSTISEGPNTKRKYKRNERKVTPSTDAGRQAKLVAPAVNNSLGKKKNKSSSGQKYQINDKPASSFGDRKAVSLLKARNDGVKGKGSGLLERMRQRLQGGRFRWLNEKLYTCQGNEALDIMGQEPELYTQYHEGFREQTKGWPVQPVDVAIKWLSQKSVALEVADLGCGDARLASSVPQQRVRSFDLVATAPGVEACNMAQLPLQDDSLDVAVFCLSLMGTDYGSFLEEAQRVLRPGGWLWIAEVQSRFVNELGGNIIDQFIQAIQSLGLELKYKNLKNPFFLNLVFQRGTQQCIPPPHALEWPELRACQYKKR